MRKSMLIEAMGNYWLGVDFKDPYRFQMKKEDGPTNSITSYTFFTRDEKFPLPVTLIDTPGFQKGTPELDLQLMEDIRTFAQEMEIHAVSFVVPGSQVDSLFRTKEFTPFSANVGHRLTGQAEKVIEELGQPPQQDVTFLEEDGHFHKIVRLTAEQKMVLGNINKVLGEKTEMYLFCTFADGKRLPVLESVAEAGLKCKKYFAVNSSAYFVKEEEEAPSTDDDEVNDEVEKEGTKTKSINELLWQMTTDSIQGFIRDIQAPGRLRSRENKEEKHEEKSGRPAGEERENLLKEERNNEGSTRPNEGEPVQENGNSRSSGEISKEDPKKQFHENLKIISQKVEGNGHPTFLLPFTSTAADGFRLGEDQQGRNSLNVLFLGFTGSGKSTLAEAMKHYLLGVDFQDSHHNQEQIRSTNTITLYNCRFTDKRRFSWKVTLIDTPGFQRETPRRKQKKFVNDVCASMKSNHEVNIHAIVYGKFTAKEKELLGSITKVFERENERTQKTYLFYTFADNNPLPAQESVKEAGLTYNKHFPVNGYAYLAKEENGPSIDKNEELRKDAKSINELLRKITTDSFQRFFDDVLSPPIEALSLIPSETRSHRSEIRMPWRRIGYQRMANEDDRRPKEILYEELKKKENAIQGKDLHYYPLPFQLISTSTDRFRLGNAEKSGECLNVLLLGLTGSGKSMLEEVIGNYGLGVDFRDPYRFQMKEDRPTERITSHTFFTRDKERFPKAVTLIDTPGFQKGTLEEDRKLMEDIRAFIHLHHHAGVHAIVYVVQGSQVASSPNCILLYPPREQGRLTTEQRLVLENMGTVLGQEPQKIQEISYLFCTFADSMRLPVVESVKESGLKFNKHYTVNCSSYFTEEEDEEYTTDDDEGNRKQAKTVSINELLWKMTTDSIREFMDDIQGNRPVQALELRRSGGF
ncbi:unnamed protein product [Darwinula stevensoni]|uniref:Uncharacterized protein n=1 Tax=Darwinula stevensoni TaxID=69355 RepID=A0A7R8X1G9_9CRUS|nr:unnamed protein product [Darwinula stevensoni]CAG0879991.1 unnamed protein product [Darwinula stevensoni]